MNTFLVAIGGGLGAITRYLLGRWLKAYLKERPIPTAMLFVNLIGAFGLGLFFNLAYSEIPIGAYNIPLYLFLGIGFFGAFTTFSTFSLEAVMFLQKKKWLLFLCYLFLSIAGSLGTFLIGFLLF